MSITPDIVKEHFETDLADTALQRLIDSDAVLRGHIRTSLKAWSDAMAGVAREAGLSTPVARRHAEEALVRIQGSLVVARITGDAAPFARALKSLVVVLTDPDNN